MGTTGHGREMEKKERMKENQKIERGQKGSMKEKERKEEGKKRQWV